MSGALAHLQETMSAGINFKAVHCLTKGHFLFLYIYGWFGCINFNTSLWARREGTGNAELLHLVLTIPLCCDTPSVPAAHSTACLEFFLTCTKLLSVSILKLPSCFRTCLCVDDKNVHFFLCLFFSFRMLFPWGLTVLMSAQSYVQQQHSSMRVTLRKHIQLFPYAKYLCYSNVV